MIFPFPFLLVETNDACRVKCHQDRARRTIAVHHPTSILKTTLLGITPTSDFRNLLNWQIDSRRPDHQPNFWSRLL